MTKTATLLIHHAAGGAHTQPPNSLSALQTCLEARARVVEVDISPLADGNFALLHGPSLEQSTDGSGPISEQTTAQIRRLRRVWRGSATDEPVGLLSDALEMIRGHAPPVSLQLDLKPYAPLSDATLAALVAALEPVKERVQVSSIADWDVRRLRALDADLPLGFDPMLYLDAGPRGPEDKHPPVRLGAYGYWDDHPLASRRWGSAARYLAARAEALWAQAPAGALWYIAAPLLVQSLDDGFDWIAELHSRGAQVAAWTLDADRPEQVALARHLAALGVDRITTNNPAALARALDGGAVY